MVAICKLTWRPWQMGVGRWMFPWKLGDFQGQQVNLPEGTWYFPRKFIPIPIWKNPPFLDHFAKAVDFLLQVLYPENGQWQLWSRSPSSMAWPNLPVTGFSRTKHHHLAEMFINRFNRTSGLVSLGKLSPENSMIWKWENRWFPGLRFSQQNQSMVSGRVERPQHEASQDSPSICPPWCSRVKHQVPWSYKRLQHWQFFTDDQVKLTYIRLVA